MPPGTPPSFKEDAQIDGTVAKALGVSPGERPVVLDQACHGSLNQRFQARVETLDDATEIGAPPPASQVGPERTGDRIAGSKSGAELDQTAGHPGHLQRPA